MRRYGKVTKLPLAVCGALILLSGCSSRGANETPGRREYEGSAERTLADLGARIDSLSDEVKTRTDSTKVQLERRIRDLNGQVAEANQQLTKLKATGKKSWDTMKRDVDRLVDRIDAGVDTLQTKLRR